jgi:hypothetical protein
VVKCFKCDGPYHPATGWYFKAGVQYCGRCARDFASWYKARVAQRTRDVVKLGGEFVASAVTSIRPIDTAPPRA